MWMGFADQIPITAWVMQVFRVPTQMCLPTAGP